MVLAPCMKTTQPHLRDYLAIHDWVRLSSFPRFLAPTEWAPFEFATRLPERRVECNDGVSSTQTRNKTHCCLQSDHESAQTLQETRLQLEK